jgi:hypothetical protein
LRANATYVFTESSSSGNFNDLLNKYQNTNYGRRVFTYQMTALYVVSSSLNVEAGASRGRTSTAQPTLSTLPVSPEPNDRLAYIGVNYASAITRRLTYRATARNEHRVANGDKSDMRTVEMNLDYRIRQVLVNFNYRWNAWTPENGLTTQVQSYYVRLTRPF